MRISMINDIEDSVSDLSVVFFVWFFLVDVIFVLILIFILDKRIYLWFDRKGWSLSVFIRILIGKFNDYLILVFFNIVNFFFFGIRGLCYKFFFDMLFFYIFIIDFSIC